MKTLVLLFFNAFAFFSLLAQPGRNGIDEGIKRRNINEERLDTFYHLQHDTIYKVEFDFSKKAIKKITHYTKNSNGIWICIQGNLVKESGKFKKKKHGLRYIFKPKRYKVVIKIDKWKYYDDNGTLIMEIKHGR